MDVSQLHSLIRKGSVAAVKQLVQHGSKKQNQTSQINTFHDGKTALHFAASEGRSEIVSVLLEV